MRTIALAALLTACMPAVAQAHEIWVERDGAGPARIYLGEPAEALPPGGDPEFVKLKAPQIVPASDAAQVRKAGFIEVAVPPGDVRVTDDSVFAPWGETGAKEGVAYYARAGRSEARAALPYEIAPLGPNGDRFALMKAGKPVAGAKILVIAPDKRTETLIAGADGAVTVKPQAGGRYLLTATEIETGKLSVAGGPVDKLYHMASTSFVVPAR